MSTTVAPPTPPTPPRPERSAGRRAAVWLGGTVAVLGVTLALAGGGILAAFGADGVLSTDRHAFSTPTSALVSETASINDTADVADVLGHTRIRIDARAAGSRPVFVGIGRAADVERYLAGAATDEVTDFDTGPFDSGFGVERRRHTGAATPAAPGGQSFWIARSTGRDAAVDWKVRDGDYRVVVMNADGSRGVATRSTFGVRIPYVPGIGIAILAAGVLLTAAGFTSIALGARRARG